MSKHNLMFFLSQIIPSYRYEVYTAMSKQTILKTVQSHTGSFLGGNDFSGKIEENGFRIQPYTKGINRLCPPLIEATVYEANGVSEIHYHMHIVPYYQIGCIVLLGLMAVFFFSSLAMALFLQDWKELLSALNFLAFFLLFESIIQLTFRLPLKKARKKLDDLLIL